MAVQPIKLTDFVRACGFFKSETGGCRNRGNDLRECGIRYCPEGWPLSAELPSDQTLMSEAGLDPELLDEERWMIPVVGSRTAWNLRRSTPLWALVEENEG